MRLKDNDKVTRIYDAAMTVVNSEGFGGCSMSKIAKEANVSVATIYLYFENKNDMISKLFVHLKSRMGHSYFHQDNALTPSKETFKTIWFNHYQYIRDNISEYEFLENFSNSPLIERVEKEHTLDYCPVFESLFERSKISGVLNDANNDIIFSLLFSPISYMVKKTKSLNLTLSTAELNQIFEASWKSIAK